MCTVELRYTALYFQGSPPHDDLIWHVADLRVPPTLTAPSDSPYCTHTR